MERCSLDDPEQDYFSFEKGLKAEGGASTENQQKIREWLKNNP